MTAGEGTRTLDGEFLRDLVERYEAAWHAHDADAFLACHTEDCVWEMPLIYPDGIARGHHAIRVECERAWAALPDLRFRTLDLFVSLDGTRAVQRWEGRGTLTGWAEPPGYAPTNQPVEMRGVSVWELSGERLSRVTEYFDTTEVARQIGLVPKPLTLGDRIGVFMQRLVAWRMRRQARR